MNTQIIPLSGRAVNRGLTVFPRREVLGLKASNAATLSHGGMFFPFELAFANEWNSYAHFTCYQLKDGAVQTPAHRLTKECEGLPGLQGQIEMVYVCIDFDLPKNHLGEKISWGELGTLDAADGWRTFLQQMQGPLGQWRHWCTSASGWHLTYVLSSALTPSVFEAVARGMRRDFEALGVTVDDQCSDWTRFYAMPRVVKPNGMIMSAQPWYRECWRDAVLDPSQIKPEVTLKGMMAYRAAEAARPQDMPNPDDAISLVYANGDVWKPTKLGADMRKKLEEALPYANEHSHTVRALLDPVGKFSAGSRDHAVSQTSGWVVSKLVAVPECSAEAVFGLFAPACERTDRESPREEGGSWLDKAWVKIHEWWAKDSARLAEEIAVQKAVLASTKAQAGGAEGIAERVLQGVNMPELRDPQRRKAVLQRIAICIHGNSDYYALQEDGTYRGPYPSLNVAIGGLAQAVALETGLCWMTEKDGKLQQRWQTAADIQRLSCARVTDVLSTFGTPIGRSRIVEANDNDMLRLVTNGAGINKHIVPRWSDRVDRLMRVQTGCSLSDNSVITKEYRELYFWLSHVTMVSRFKLPALFLYGPPRTGKSMWCRAVAKLFSGSPSSGHVLTQRWNLSLAHSAVVAADEGLPSMRGNGGRQATQILRKIIVGDPVAVEGKGMQIRMAQMNWRVIVSENSPDSFYQLMDSFGQFAARDEKKALGQRIHLLRVSGTAAEWITQNQESLFPEDGSADFTLEMAQHVAYLAVQIEEHRNTTFADIYSCRVGNLIQFAQSVTKEDAIEALSAYEYHAMVSLMEEIVSLACVPVIGTERRTDFGIDENGSVIASRSSVSQAAGKREQNTSFGRPKASEKGFVDMLTASVEPDRMGSDQRRARKQLYDLCTGEPIGAPLQRRWRKIELDILLRHLEEHDVPGLDIFIERLTAFKEARGLTL